MLQECITHLRGRVTQGLNAAGAILDDNDFLLRGEVDGICIFSGGISGKAKCNVLEAFGKALHGAQDFYSHSNWVDVTSRPPSVLNPPGLNLTAPSYILDFRTTAPVSPPTDLSTGCFAGLISDKIPGEKGMLADCRGRVTHNTLNKDNGKIDTVTGDISDPTTPRGKVNGNFERAVRAAVIETQRQWKDFREELKVWYGARRANLMICALTHDDPVRDCHGRKVGIVVNGSGSKTVTRQEKETG